MGLGEFPAAARGGDALFCWGKNFFDVPIEVEGSSWALCSLGESEHLVAPSFFFDLFAYQLHEQRLGAIIFLFEGELVAGFDFLRVGFLELESVFSDLRQTREISPRCWNGLEDWLLSSVEEMAEKLTGVFALFYCLFGEEVGEAWIVLPCAPVGQGFVVVGCEELVVCLFV